MSITRSMPKLCPSCTGTLANIFIFGFTRNPASSRSLSSRLRPTQHFTRHFLRVRSFSQDSYKRAVVEDEYVKGKDELALPRSARQMEELARRARQTFGDTLPADFLTPEEYSIYERLYGAPSAIMTDSELRDFGKDDTDLSNNDDSLDQNVLLKQGADGEFEEVNYNDDVDDHLEQEGGSQIRRLDMEAESSEASDTVEGIRITSELESQTDFQARIEALRAATIQRYRATAVQGPDAAYIGEEAAEVPADMAELEITGDVDDTAESIFGDYGRNLEMEEPEDDQITRVHPLTALGQFGTRPSTISLPRDTMVDPTTALLADASNKHLSEVAHKVFGGVGLPKSTASIKRPNMKQEGLALLASQSRMGEMEANAYLATVMPGSYAASLSALVEVRKRLGTTWLRRIMADGPRVLDAGSGGAAVLAWQEIIRAEWETLHPEGVPQDQPAPLGQSTVVTGSDTLRHRASKLLDNTSFIPRLPDYDPSRDHPSLENNNPQPRKQYDIIIAPHTLWHLKEDYLRKDQIQNFWSLLDPRGGVLILIEKGVPRGFELIAGARETLLKYHISSPGSEQFENDITSASPNRFGTKEKGMIIAPCTNHAKCPMYITTGPSTGRKDFCYFSHRFVRPAYLQRIIGAKERNHEDVKFSYIALQRGVDLREDLALNQGNAATQAAFDGHEELAAEIAQENQQDASPTANPLTFPRAILPPIKRRGHVILDLCTPAGKIERWTVPKSFSKQAYRDARKSKWGDLWALGAKTRIERNIRVGIKKTTARIDNIETDVDVPDNLPDADFDPALAPAKASPRKYKYKRQPKHRQKLNE